MSGPISLYCMILSGYKVPQHHAGIENSTTNREEGGRECPLSMTGIRLQTDESIPPMEQNLGLYQSLPDAAWPVGSFLGLDFPSS